jgi:tRNA threonylcarbamoyladenosine biosynthesis protein TsaB
VSLAEKGKVLYEVRKDEGYAHAENLHLFIEENLKKTGMKVSQLQAIAVSKGPGSYTGLRIGVSAAKGLSYSLKIPLISVDTLQIMSAGILHRTKNFSGYYCPMIDARRMEVYTAVYDAELRQSSDVEALIIAEENLSKFIGYEPIYFFGDGMEKCREILSSVKGSNFLEDVKPRASDMSQLSFQKFIDEDFENTAYFEPFYLKSFQAGKKKKTKE